MSNKAEDGQIVGYSAVDQLNIQSVYVSGGWRMQHVATALIKSIINDVASGVELSANVPPSNAAALALF
jgi:hypothetical protein